MGEKENGTLNTAIETGFTEKVTFEKEANCSYLGKSMSQARGTARTKAGGISDGFTEKQRGDVTEAKCGVRSEK